MSLLRFFYTFYTFAFCFCLFCFCLFCFFLQMLLATFRKKKKKSTEDYFEEKMHFGVRKKCENKCYIDVPLSS